MIIVHSTDQRSRSTKFVNKKERHLPDFRLSGMILSMPVNWLMGSKYSHIYIYCTFIILVSSILVNL